MHGEFSPTCLTRIGNGFGCCIHNALPFVTARACVYRSKAVVVTKIMKIEKDACVNSNLPIRGGNLNATSTMICATPATLIFKYLGAFSLV